MSGDRMIVGHGGNSTRKQETHKRPEQNGKTQAAF